MHSQLKLTGWWTAYAILLILLSGALYVYGPRVGPPEIWVTAEPDGFGPAGLVRLVFHTDRLVKETLVVSFDLKGEEGASKDRDFDLVQKKMQAEIRAGTQDSTPLDLRKREIVLPQDAVPKKKQASVIVTLQPIEGFTLKPGDIRTPTADRDHRPRVTARAIHGYTQEYSGPQEAGSIQRRGRSDHDRVSVGPGSNGEGRPRIALLSKTAGFHRLSRGET